MLLTQNNNIQFMKTSIESSKGCLPAQYSHRIVIDATA